MRIDDRLVGLVLVALGVAVYLIARTFPLMAGMPYGPGFFPSIAAIGLIVCGIVVAVSGALAALAEAGGTLRWRPTPGEAARATLLRPIALCIVIVFFGLALNPLGFHIAATITVAAAAFVFGAGLLSALTLALASAFAVHAVFYSLLRVPLPWGGLTPYAW